MSKLAHKATTKRIVEVQIRQMVDESPDTSWLGEYTGSPTSEFSIDRDHQEDCPMFWAGFDGYGVDCNCVSSRYRNEYRYFNPSFNYVDAKGNASKGNTPDDVRKNTKLDYERMERLNAGDWHFVGIAAEAEIVVGGVCQTITSGGLWGVESDSDATYLREIADEQLGELREQLHALGFSKRAIAAAFRDVQEG